MFENQVSDQYQSLGGKISIPYSRHFLVDALAMDIFKL